MMPVRLAILTVSDSVSRGEREDTSGNAIQAWAERLEFQVAAREVVPDEAERIEERLLIHADSGAIDLIVTTGGTGFTDRDVTPEATRAVIRREAPGLAEAIRRVGAESTPYAWLSRGVAGIRSGTVIINLPGSTGGVRDGIAVLERLVPHAVQLLRGVDTGLHPGHG